LFCLFLEGQIRWNLAAIFFHFIYFHVLFKSWAQTISHKGEKKLDTRGRALRIIRMWCSAIEFPFPVRAGRQKKKKLSKQAVKLFWFCCCCFFKCWWTRVINTGFFFNVVEAGEKQQHIYIKTIILLQLLTFFIFHHVHFSIFFQHHFFGPYKLNFGMEHHIKFISILTVRVLFDLINVL